MANLVASVMLVFAPFRTAVARSSAEPATLAWHHGLEAISPAVADDDDGRFAASRQPATAASSAAGLNGFCRLESAPSLVAIVRKSGPCSGFQASGRPEMTMIGVSGRF